MYTGTKFSTNDATYNTLQTKLIFATFTRELNRSEHLVSFKLT